MAQIHKSAHVSDPNGSEFYKKMSEMIDMFQTAGLTVEVQYQQTLTVNGLALFSAVILGRK